MENPARTSSAVSLASKQDGVELFDKVSDLYSQGMYLYLSDGAVRRALDKLRVDFGEVTLLCCAAAIRAEDKATVAASAGATSGLDQPVDIDVVVRDTVMTKFPELSHYLVEECQRRGLSFIYARHPESMAEALKVIKSSEGINISR